MEDLVLLVLAAVLLVSTVVSTREHMEPTPMSKDASVKIVKEALQKKGPKGTLALFDAQIQKMEDLVSHDNDRDE